MKAAVYVACTTGTGVAAAFSFAQGKKGWKEKLMRGEDPNDSKRTYEARYQHDFHKSFERIAELFNKMTADEQRETIAFMEKLVSPKTERKRQER